MLRPLAGLGAFLLGIITVPGNLNRTDSTESLVKSFTSYI